MASTSSMVLEGNTIIDSMVNMYQNTSESMVPQTSGQSKAKQLSKLCYFPNLPETVDKREDVVGNLRKLMSKHHKVVITGIAGLGKTTLANLCARKWVEDGTYQHAIFVNMETEESASGVYKRLAKIVLDIKDDDYCKDTIPKIYQHLSKYHILIIFDNIDENCVFHKYYPSKELTNIDILGTSQLTELKRLFHPYPLQKLSKVASVQLILDIFISAEIKVPATVVPMITDLVIKLEFHPLALQHAAALIIDMFNNDIRKMSLEQSVNKYKKHFEIQLKQEFPTDHLSEYRKSIYAAISLNVEKATIGKEHVQSLLHCMTYLDPSGINIKIFYKTFSTDDIDESLRQLLKYSLIKVNGDIISMHRLIPEVCHAMLTADKQKIYLSNLLNTFFFYMDWRLSIAEQCSFLIEHFEMYFKINKEELAAYYKAAFHNNLHIKKRLTARLQMINCVISDTEGWSVQQCCVFAGHQTFYKYFTGMGEDDDHYTITTQFVFIPVIRDSSLYLFGDIRPSILNFYKDNKEELNKPIFKNLTILSMCAAFGIRDDYDDDDYYNYYYSDDDDYIFNTLIDMGCDVNITDNKSMTPILWAARNMCYENVFTLLDRGATCDVICKKVLTAAAAGDGKSVLQLIRTSEISYATDNYGKMLLWWAADRRHHDIVRELIQRGTDTSGADARGNTLLHMVAREGYEESVSQFIRAAGDVNLANSDGDTALILATMYGHEKIVSELIGAKADLNIANSYGNTALILAAKEGHDEIVSQLIGAEVNVNIANSNGDTALILAAMYGHDKIVSQLIGVEVDVNIATRYCDTALICAAEKGHDEIVSKLIGAEVDVNIANSYGNTALIRAAEKGHDEIVSQLIGAEVDVNIANSNGDTALILAAMYGHDKIVSQLIGVEVDVNIATRYGDTALILAAMFGRDKIVSQLIGAGANVNIANSDGDTALILAAKKGHDKIVSQLIGAEVNVNIANSYGDTALILAAKEGRDEIVSQLIGAEVNVNIANSDGNTALIFAIVKGHDKIVSKLIGAKVDVNIANSYGNTALIHAVNVNVANNTPLYRELVTEFVNRGAHVDTANKQGTTPLLLAAEYKHREISMYLVEKGASVNAVENWGKTPLYWAARNGDRELVTELVNRGAHVDTATKHGTTPLLLAAEYKYREISMYLVEKGASVNAVDGDGDTPLLFAAKHGDYELVVELINRGARTDTPANNRGETPLSWARQNKDDRMCALLQVNEEGPRVDT